MQKSKRTFEKENLVKILGEQIVHEKELYFESTIIYKLFPCFPLLHDPSPGRTRNWEFSPNDTAALGKAILH